jgi:hypothetical protein
MEIFKTVLMICCFSMVLGVSSIVPQNRERPKNRTASSSAKDKKVEPGDYFPENEIESRFRYVIVDDDVQFDDEETKQVPVRRFVQVLMDERAFNKANLTYLFRYLSNYYNNPAYLGIEVHTSLMTLETLEERTAISTHSSRDDFRQFYKTASYSRFNDRSEGFLYYTGRPGKFITKFVDLPKAAKK